MPSPRPLTDAEHAGAVLCHPLSLQLSSTVVEALSAIATGDGRALSSGERQLLRQVFVAIECAEVLISRRPA